MYVSETGTIIRWFSGACLERSSDNVLWSLLSISGWFNRSRIKWLLFWAVRFLCFFAYARMNSFTYGMWKLLCRVYQGAKGFVGVRKQEILICCGQECDGIWKQLLSSRITFDASFMTRFRICVLCLKLLGIFCVERGKRQLRFDNC
jgi:hypothetical protein